MRISDWSADVCSSDLVDTHIFRVGNRTGLAPGKTVLAVEKQLEKKVPGPFRIGAHHWLILHGRYICKARTPECWRCPVADLCRYKTKTPAPQAEKAARQEERRAGNECGSTCSVWGWAEH